MSFSVALVKLHWFGINWHVFFFFFFNQDAEIVACILLLRKSCHTPNLESTSKYGFCPDLGGGGGGEMAALWACACKLPWTLFSPAWVQPLYGTGRKESSGTELGLPMVFSSFASTDTLTNKERDSTFELSATDCTDFELLVSAGEELVWKYKSFDFTVEWFADFELFASCESTVLWFDS